MVSFVLMFSLSHNSSANESIEKESTNDIGLASIWLMSEITQGGYLKPSTGLSVFDGDPNMMWEIEGGWRFTNWFKLGFSLESSISDIDRINDPAILIGFVAGVSGRNPSIGNFSLDLNFGQFEMENSNNKYFVEPGFHVKKRLYKKIYWTSGITYRYVENETLTPFGKNSLNSFSLKLGLTGSKY